MQVSFEQRENFTVVAHVSIPSSDVSPIYNTVVEKFVRNGSVPGFRKGKSPKKLIIAKYAGVINEEASNSLIQEALRFVYDKPEVSHSLERATVTNISELSPDKDLNIDFSFVVAPKVELKPLSEIEVAKFELQIKDEDISNMIEALRKQKASLRNIDEGTASEEHFATIDFVGRIDGEAFEGGTANGVRVNLANEESMIPGFIAQIKGHQIGDKFDINCTFPEDYHAEKLRGKPAVFETTLKSLSVQELPDDAKLCEHFSVANIDELKTNLARNMNHQGNALLRNLNLDNIQNAIEKAYGDIELPQVLLDRATRSIAQQRLRKFCAQSGIQEENILKTLFNNIFESVQRETDLVKKEAKSSFLLSNYLEQGLEPSESDTSKAYNSLIDEESSSFDDPEAFKEHVKNSKEESRGLHAQAYNMLVAENFFKAMHTTVEVKDFSFVQARLNEMYMPAF